MTFAIGIDPDAPMPELLERAHIAEAMGFDAVYVPDHSRDWRVEEPKPGALWFDGPTTVAAFATVTKRVRIGTMVANPILRTPDLLAREAIALDHLSGGRLTLAIGTGIAPFDHRATGTPRWTFKQRVARLGEYVAVVDGILRADGRFTFNGEFFHVDHDALASPVQTPRPPITLGGASEQVRAIAIERAECWNTTGRWGVPPEKVVDDLIALNREVDAACEHADRDPASLQRSAVIFDHINPWTKRGRLTELVERLTEAGYEEFVTLWPGTDEERAVFEADVPALTNA